MVLLMSMETVNNTHKQESVLKKKKNAVCYHTVCKSVAMGKSLITHIDGNENLSNLLATVLFYKQYSA